ncbi:MAG TPA: hypothetical protein VK986_12640 [Tepidisphaeraceae bacterium]|nr:hypothetical protein [Tepidisphaeraceae bacterium]
MPVTDHDLEQLDLYLDDGLSSVESEAVRVRLAGDAEFRGELESARAERAGRQSYFAALEPSDAETAGLVARLTAAIGEPATLAGRIEHARRGRWVGAVRYVAAAAACVVVGLLLRPLIDANSGSSSTVARDGKTADVRPVAVYEVTLRDAGGKVIAVQRFDSPEQAQEFAADFARWQGRNERLASGKFVVTADRF